MPIDKPTLVAQRQMLREQLLAQRELIAQQIDPARETSKDYPRSMTMRFLTDHSTLAGGLFTGAATLLVGARYFKSIAAALAMYKIVRTAVKDR